ncbi:DUF3987 domain-containing protein [Leptospira interrogans]
MELAKPILQPSPFHNIPNEMRAYANFVVWRFEQRADAKLTKIPYQVRTGGKASVNHPSHWSSFEDAIAVADNYDGIGFVFSENDPFTGIDLDDTHGDTAAIEHQKTIFQQFDSYSEFSPSGNGLHIIVKGTVPSGRRRGFVEMYSSGRYFTMTGNVYNDRPIVDRQSELDALWAQLSEGKPPTMPMLRRMHSDEPDQSIIVRALNAQNGTKFRALWNGDGSALDGSDKSGSAIDQALVNIIQFYTKDPAQIERVWLLSPQGQREKTRTRKDYRDRTIARSFDRKLPQVELQGMQAVVCKADRQSNPAEAPRPLRRELPPPTVFPIEQLGTLLGSAANAIIEKVQCADAIAAMSVLGAASLAAQAHADVVIPATTHAKPLSLFLVTVAASGERKSAADIEALWPIRQFEKELYDYYNAAMPAYRNKMDAWEAQREKIKRDRQGDIASKAAAFDSLGFAPTPPLTPMLTCPEPTFEGLCKLYANGMPMLGIFSDEGGQFVGGHGLSPDNRLRTITGLSSLWDGSPIKRVRVTDGVSVLPGRRLAVHLMMQPDVASALLCDPVLKDQGFLSRILVASPVGIAGTRFQRRTSYSGSEALVRYNSRLLQILRLTPPLAMGKQNELEPRKLPLDNSAMEMWRDYADAVESRVGKDGEFDPIRHFANKLPEHAARIAGVLTLVENPSALAINTETFERATIIAEYFASQSLRLFDAGLASPGIRLAETLLTWLQNKWAEPFVGLKVIYQRGPNLIREAEGARKAVSILEEHGWLERAPNGTKVADAVVKEAWRVIRRSDAESIATPATLLLPNGRVAE